MGLFDSIFGGGGAKAAKKAAQAQERALNKSIDFQERSLNRVLGLNAPFLDAGFDATNDIRTILGYDLPGFRPDFGAPLAKSAGAAPDQGTAIPQAPLDDRRSDLQNRFESSPIYQNVYRPAIDEGTKSIERMAKARGGLYSGSTLRGISDYAGQLGSRTWQQFQDTITRLAGSGQQASGAAQGAIQGTAQGIGQNYTDIGNAQAQGYYNAANARSTAFSNAAKIGGNAIALFA